MRNNIVILGGMGPQASLHLHDAILKASRCLHNGAPDAYPSIIHLSMQIPDFIGNSDNELQAIRIINRALKQHAAPGDTISLACNTAHNLLEHIRIPGDGFVSILHAVISEVANSSIHAVGLLASPNTLASGLYERPLRTAGLDVIKPTEHEIEELEKLIRSVIDGTAGSGERARLNHLAQQLKARGAEGIILGCTELPVIGVDSDLPVFDSIRALAKDVVKKHSCYNGDNR